MLNRIISMLLILAMCVALASCSLASGSIPNDDNPPANDTDKEGDTGHGTPDNKDIFSITKDGMAAVNLVVPYSLSNEVKPELDEFKAAFSRQGIELKVKYETDNNPETPEILIGNKIGARGDYYIDSHSLGDEGYAIRMIDGKLVVASGSDKSLVDALVMLRTDVLGLNNPDTDIKNLSISTSMDITKRQEYSIKSISILGIDLSKYVIFGDSANIHVYTPVTMLRDALYSESGYWLDITNKEMERMIRFDIVDDAGEDGFRVITDGGNLVIQCEYYLLLEECVTAFISDILLPKEERSIDFGSDYLYTRYIKSIGYCSYGGAVGDGVTVDIAAIKATHDRANKTGQTVVAESGKTFNLGIGVYQIEIRTDTVWTGATFIIDDREVPVDSVHRTRNLFAIKSDNAKRQISGITSLKAGQENIGVTFDSDVLLYIVDETKKQYIRYGLNQDEGAPQQEVILVDKDGNVDPSTPILWDYSEISSAIAYSADDKPITIDGGTFITYANQAPSRYTYFSRGITISRSNTTVKNMTHLIEGEGEHGAPYAGFHNISYCANVLFENVVYTAHKTYQLETNAANSMGSYDFSAESAINITWKNCRQSNDINDTAYWGIMGSNYCKNITYDSCSFSRLDAHKGTHNATVRDSEIGHQHISIIGSGTLLIENTKVYGNSVVELRSDYGSTWHGDIIMRNVELVNTSNSPLLISGGWSNHYFGYQCYMPSTVTIDGITLAKGNSFSILPSISSNALTSTVNPIVATERIIIASNPHGYTYKKQQWNTGVFNDTEILDMSSSNISYLPPESETAD